MMNNTDFNNEIKNRTVRLYIQIYKLIKEKKPDILDQSITRQLIRSSSSISANWCAAVIARSKKEFYSKMCIVVEECDETIHWLHLLKQMNFFKEKEIDNYFEQYQELLRIFLSIRKKLR